MCLLLSPDISEEKRKLAQSQALTVELLVLVRLWFERIIQRQQLLLEIFSDEEEE